MTPPRIITNREEQTMFRSFRAGASPAEIAEDHGLALADVEEILRQVGYRASRTSGPAPRKAPGRKTSEA